MRFAIPFYPGKALRLSHNVSDWPLASRFALLIIPLGVCLVVCANWLGYHAAKVSLRDSLSSLPMLEAKMQATTMRETLERFRNNLLRIAQGDTHDTQILRENLALFLQDSDPLLHELSFTDNSGNGFLLLRDNGGFKTLSATDAALGPYSPFQQVSGHLHESGKAAVHSPVFFDDPSATVQHLDARVPVIRMSLALPDNNGVLIAGINMLALRDKISASMKPESGLRLPVQDGTVQLSFFFDTRGWILFEMDGGKGGYTPDMAREGYGGDLGRGGYDTAFRPWASHMNYWHMVTEVADGRAGSSEAPADKYTSAQTGSDGILCYAPVLFSPADGVAPQVVGGIAFFETSTLPLAAFLRYANYGVGVLVASLILLGLLAFIASKKLADPLNVMAEELGAMAESGQLAFVNTTPACEEQQKIQAAVNTVIAGAMASRNDVNRLSNEINDARSRLPADLSQPLPKPLPIAEFGLVGSSALIGEVREHVRKAARAGTDVLVWGETGTGKELVAAAIHKAGNRPDGTYISINCGALDENLLLDALFGHVKGAFSEAKSDRKGAFLAAEGGTLHLDEIANASLKVQQSLLRALSVRRIRPLGTDEEIPFNTRVVAATNVDLRECVRAGTFREDLYFRLAIISIETPPLRHRKEDIPELAAFCIHEAAKSLGRPEARLSRGALELMAGYDWPGNVREFKNCLTRAMAFVESDLILPQHITLEQDAFRTYAKPISAVVLAEKIHPAEPGAPGFPKSREPGRTSGARAPSADAVLPERFDPLSGSPFPGQRAADRFTPFLPGGMPPQWRRPTSPAVGSPGSVVGARADSMTGSAAAPVPRPHGQASPYPAARDAETGNGLAGLNERQLRAVAFIRQYGEITRPEYEEVAGQGVSSRTAQNDLRELVERGILVRVGAGPGTRYIDAGAA